MGNLIEAFIIFLKYGNPAYPTACEHDVLYVPTIDYDAVSEDDKTRLEQLGFEYNSDGDMGFMSFKYGSC